MSNLLSIARSALSESDPFHGVEESRSTRSTLQRLMLRMHDITWCLGHLFLLSGIALKVTSTPYSFLVLAIGVSLCALSYLLSLSLHLYHVWTGYPSRLPADKTPLHSATPFVMVPMCDKCISTYLSSDKVGLTAPKLDKLDTTSHTNTELDITDNREESTELTDSNLGTRTYKERMAILTCP